MSAQKRNAPGSKNNKRSKKQKYIEAAGFALNHQTRGVLVSCTDAAVAQREALSLLNEFYEKLYGDTDAAPASNSTNIGALLQQEVANLKDTSKQVFRPVNTSLPDLVFISMTGAAGGVLMGACHEFRLMLINTVPHAGVVDIVLAVARDAAATKTLKSRHCLRLIPVEVVCGSSLEDIGKACEDLVKPHFPPEGPCVPFACVLECRSTKHLKKMDVIDAAIQGIAQPPHKANLNTPKKSILVQLFKSMCCLAVVDDFRALSRFNLRELCAVEEEGGAQEAAPDGDKTTEET